MSEILEVLVNKPTMTDKKPVESRYFNFVQDDDIAAQVTARIIAAWNRISDRTDIEEVWKRNDEIMRVKPDTTKNSNNRANVGAAEICIAINQLVSIGYSVLLDNPNAYKYEVDAVAGGDDVSAQIRKKNAAILTALFRKIQQDKRFKRNIRKALYDIYKYGTCFAIAAMADESETWEYKKENKLDSWTVNRRVPFLKHVPIRDVWTDDTIDDLPKQQAVFIRDRKTWSELITDHKNGLVSLPEPEEGGSIREACAVYADTSTTQEDSVQDDQWDNAGRDLQDRTREMYYKHWVIFARLPLKGNTKDAAEWDDDTVEEWYRIRILGDPMSGKVIEIRKSPYPGGLPMLIAHQSEDDLGLYHASLIEKCDTYHEQICTSLNQLIDNRSKNVRRPIVYDVGRAPLMKKYDFGHSNSVPVDGNPNEIFREMDIADMTQTIMASVQYNASMIRLITNTTDAVVGQAMGGRTSAAEYRGARIAATTPIYADMASIETALIVEFMKKLAMYVHRFMSHEDLFALLGPDAFEFQFDHVGHYTVVARGVVDAMEKAEKIQNLLQLLGLTQDPTRRDAIILRLAETMEIENPNELVARPASDQAIKAALWENNEMLVLGEWDSPERGEQHDIHLPIHLSAKFSAKQAGNPNIAMLDRHIQETEELRRQEQAAAGQFGVRAIGQPGAPLPPGSTFGEQTPPDMMASAMGGMETAGSPIPSMSEQVPA